MRFSNNGAGDTHREPAAQNPFFPLATLKSFGAVIFRSQASRDVACLLDVDVAVSSWVCAPKPLVLASEHYICDFLVTDVEGVQTLMDAHDRQDGPDQKELTAAAASINLRYRRWDHAAVHSGFRLRNSKDLIRYANYTTALGDRVRLLAALNENGTLSVAECLSAFQETKPIAGLASMILGGFIEIDLDEALIGPETKVRRIVC
ncbi:MAG: hypothetical protein VR78_10575 [Hoeflea sp. BRH_c9]|nr:MAG: hypothetical protein VR78_10575 [Hoeflea sp. BRH_c9]